MIMPDNNACMTYKYGATNKKANSTGSVTPVKKDARAAYIKVLRILGFRSSRASWMIAKAIAGRANIIVG
ncbi:hypothetical protein D3C78_1705650 [compost metagenome]